VNSVFSRLLKNTESCQCRLVFARNIF